MNALVDFFSRDAGQARRNWLDSKVNTLGEAVRYYAGPYAPNVNALAHMNPVQDVGNAMAAGRDGRWGDMAVDVATVVAPVAAGKAAKAINPRVADDAAQWLQDALTGISVNPTRAGLGDAGQAVVDRMNQPGPVPTMYSNPIMRAADDGIEAGAIRLWHGSPYDFDTFDLAKVGSGEGAQDLGRGFSLTDEEAISHLYTNPASRWGDLQAMERYSQAGPGRYYEVLVDAGPTDFLDWNKPWRDQVKKDTPLFDALKLQEDRLLKTYGDDPAMVEAIPRAKLGQVWRDNNNLEDAATRSGYAGNLRQNYSGDTEYTVFDPARMQIAKKFDKDGNEIPLSAPSPLPTPAQEVARLLREGRADEVTDDLLAQADDYELFRLYESGATGVDMPMDEASRMARAREMGFDADAYHGTAGDDFSAFRQGSSPSFPVDAAIWSTTTPEGGANAIALSRMQSAGQEQGRVLPVKLRLGNMLDVDAAGQHAVDVRGIRNAATEGFDSVNLQNVREFGQPQQTQSIAVFDPSNIRSRFARFDPRLKHLRNLSAAGLLGLPYMQDEGQEQ